MGRRANAWAAWIGAAVGLYGLAAVIGFAGHVRRLAQVQTGRDASMALSSAVAFIFAGLAVTLAAWAALRSRSGISNRLARQLARGLALASGVLGGLGIAENLADFNLGLDWPSLHYWLGDPALRPGRMALLTGIGLVCLAAGVWLLPAQGRRARPRCWILILAAAAAATAGLIGYWLDIETVITFHGMPAQSVYAAICVLALCLALAFLASRRSMRETWSQMAANKRILVLAVTVLLVVVAGSGVSSLIMMQHMSRRDAATNLSLRRDERAQHIRSLIEEARERGVEFTRDSDLLATLAGRPVDGHLLVPREFDSVRVVRSEGEIEFSSGQTVTAEQTIQLPRAPAAELLWHSGFYLRQQIPVTYGAHSGTAILEQPLPLLASIGMDTDSWGKTGEMGVCGLPYPTSPNLECFPQRLSRHPYWIAKQLNGAERAMTKALENQSGVEMATDYRGQRVLAAYAPVPGTGLGLVVKMDTSELYTPTRRQIEVMLPLLAILMAAGLILLHFQVRPLVQELERTRSDAVRSEARFRAAASSSPDAFYIVEAERDAHGAILDFRLAFANENGARLAQVDMDRSAPARLSQLPHLNDGGFLAKLRHVVDTRQPLEEELQLPNQPGIWLHRHAGALGDGAAVTVRDISGRKQAEEQLRNMAQRDPLTGLANRRAFLAQLGHAMAASRRLRHQALLALLYLDLDRFKEVNDTWGHDQGDRLLREVGHRIAECVRTSDMVARLGGDEFTILLQNLEGPEDAERVVSCLFDALRAPVRLDRTAVATTFSVGVAYFQGEDIEADDLLRRADKAMYEAKRAGRNDYRVYAA